MTRVTYVVAALTLVLLPSVGQAAPTAKPAATTLFMHGPSQVGEVDSIGWLRDIFPPDSPFRLDPVAPAGSDMKSMSYTTVTNDQCTGQPFYPTFQGSMTGTIEGDLTLDLHFISAPATLTAQVWVDTALYQCDTNLAYVAPHSKVQFDVPAGQSAVTVTLPAIAKRKRHVETGIIVMILAPQVPAYEGQVGRLLYDSTANPSRVTFSCRPDKGAKACSA